MATAIDSSSTSLLPSVPFRPNEVTCTRAARGVPDWRTCPSDRTRSPAREQQEAYPIGEHAHRTERGHLHASSKRRTRLATRSCARRSRLTSGVPSHHTPIAFNVRSTSGSPRRNRTRSDTLAVPHRCATDRRTPARTRHELDASSFRVEVRNRARRNLVRPDGDAGSARHADLRVELRGIEPLTSSLRTMRSTN